MGRDYVPTNTLKTVPILPSILADEGVSCSTRHEFLVYHSDGATLTLPAKNHIESMKLVERVLLACKGVGFKGRMYHLISRVLPLGIRVYGKYNEIGLIAVPPIFEYVEPCLFDGL